MSERVLVTGAAGFVGKHLIDRLLAEGHDEIVATDVRDDPPESYADAIDDDVTYVQGDVTDSEFLDSLLAEPFDYIFHFAAVVGVSEYVENPLKVTEVNVVATKEILEHVREWDTRFVFTSTSEIYGKNPEVPWSETDDRVLGPPTIERWSYSISKSACEHMLHSLGKSDTPFEATVVRPFNLYGPGQRPNFVIPAFVEAVVNGGVPQIYDDGTQTRCFTHVDDFIEGLYLAATRPEGANEAFNIGSTREVQIRDLADIVLQAADVDREPEFIDTEELYGEKYEDLDRRIPDVSKADRLLDWEAETSLEAGIESVIEWGREYY